MKATILTMSIALSTLLPLAPAASASDPTPGPCLHVQIQNERNNQSSVRQECEINVSRTVQAGETNHAQTLQTGRVNDNKVRQYQYDRSRLADAWRGEHRERSRVR
jgi:hypothetical protein